MSELLIVILCGLLGGMVAMFGGVLLDRIRTPIETLWQQWRPSPPPPWRVSVLDPDGVLVRTENVTAMGTARLISDLNAGRFA